eukprot:366324-Chlamydomonas_euryale.AAC.7
MRLRLREGKVCVGMKMRERRGALRRFKPHVFLNHVRYRSGEVRATIDGWIDRWMDGWVAGGRPHTLNTPPTHT